MYVCLSTYMRHTALAWNVVSQFRCWANYILMTVSLFFLYAIAENMFGVDTQLTSTRSVTWATRQAPCLPVCHHTERWETSAQQASTWFVLIGSAGCMVQGAGGRVQSCCNGKRSLCCKWWHSSCCLVGRNVVLTLKKLTSGQHHLQSR